MTSALAVVLSLILGLNSDSLGEPALVGTAIVIDGEQSRTLTFTGRGPAYAAAIAAVRPRSAAEGVHPGG